MTSGNLIVIKSCAGLSSLTTGKQIHCVALVSGFDSDSFVLSSLVHMYVKCNSLWEARNVFDRLPQPDVVPCSALLSGQAQIGHVKEATELLHRIKHLGLGLNSVPWNGMIAGFNHSRHYLDAVVVFRVMHLEGFVLDGVGISSVLPGVGALAMLDMGIPIHCYVMKNGFEQDKCVVSALIAMYGKCSSTMEMSKVFDEMDEKAIGSCHALVPGLARNGCVDNALELFAKFKRQRMDLNVVSWTSIIASCSPNGKDIEALELFREMQVEGVQPNSRTIPSLLPACGNIATLMHGKAAHCFSLQRGISYDVHWLFLLLLFTNCVDHVEQQVTPLILVDSEASYMLQPMSTHVQLMPAKGSINGATDGDLRLVQGDAIVSQCDHNIAAIHVKPFDPGGHFATTEISSRVVLDVGSVTSAIRSAFYLNETLDADHFYSHRALSSSLFLPQPCGQVCLEGEGNVMNILVEQPVKPKAVIEPFDPQGPKEKFSA